MNTRLEELRKLWLKSDTISKITSEEIYFFQRKKGFILPTDITNYFIELNGTSSEYNDRFFKFYSFTEFKSVKDELGEWEGAPDYRNIVNTLNSHESCFVFSDYNCHLFTYAIRLNKDQSIINEVYVLCGDKYELIAKSFSEFLDLYLSDSPVLYL